MIIPTVIERNSNWTTAYDIYSRLLEDRIIYYGTQVTDESANNIIAQILYLAKKDPDKDITMYINCPGGTIVHGMAVYDAMQFVPCDINTVCVWLAASMWSILLLWGTKGKRFILPHGEVLIHQPLGGAEWQATDIEIAAQHIWYYKRMLYDKIRIHTWQDIEKIKIDAERDNRMTAQQALDYGIVDKILDYKIKWIDV
jgi:ATP-dependent Clp protease, protease subunit